MNSNKLMFIQTQTDIQKFKYKLLKSFNLFNDLDKKVTGKYWVFMCKVSIKLRWIQQMKKLYSLLLFDHVLSCAMICLELYIVYAFLQHNIYFYNL